MLGLTGSSELLNYPCSFSASSEQANAGAEQVGISGVLLTANHKSCQGKIRQGMVCRHPTPLARCSQAVLLAEPEAVISLLEQAAVISLLVFLSRTPLPRQTGALVCTGCRLHPISVSGA